MRVTPLLLSAILASFLFGCSGSNDTSNKNTSSNNQETLVLEGSDLGLVNIFISPNNNSFFYADWVVNSMMLLKEDGVLIPVTKGDPQEIFKLPLSGSGSASYLLNQIQLPRGEYVGLIISLDVDSSMFSYLTEDGVNIPTLFNADGQLYSGEYAFETVMLSFKDDKVLSVGAEPAAIRLAIDVDGAFSSLITANEDDQTTYTFLPVVEAELVDAIDEEVIVEGYLDALSNETIGLNAFYFGVQESLPFELAISESTFKKDWVAIDATDALEWVNGLNLTDTPVYLKAKGQYKSNTLSLSSVSMVDTMKWPERVAKIAFSEGFTDVTRILDKEQKTNPFFLMNIDNDQVSTFESMTFQGADWWLLDRESNKKVKGDPLSIRLAGSIKSLSPLVVEPQALNATGNNFWGFPEITVAGKQKLSSEVKEGDFVVIDGHFESVTTVNANTVSLLNDLPHRIEIRLPIISQTELAEVGAGKFMLTEKGLEESIYRAYYPSLGANIDDAAASIKTIDFSNASVVVNIGRVDPYVQIVNFSTADQASQLIKDLILEGFHINGLKADGDQDGDSFKASKLIVTVFGPSDLDLLAEDSEANLSPSLNGQRSPLLKGGAYVEKKKVTFGGEIESGPEYNSKMIEAHKKASTKAFMNAQEDTKAPVIDSRKQNLSAGTKKSFGLGKAVSFFSSQPKIWRLKGFQEKLKNNYGGSVYSLETIEQFKIVDRVNNTQGDTLIAGFSITREVAVLHNLDRYISKIETDLGKKGAFKVDSRYRSEALKTVTEFRAELERSRKAVTPDTDTINDQASRDAGAKIDTLINRISEVETTINTRKTNVTSPDTTIKKRR
jgi:hypothetical protein